MEAAASSGRRGAPLAVMGILIAGWIATRAFIWENPFPIEDLDLGAADLLFAQNSHTREAPEAAIATSSSGDRREPAPVAAAGFLASAPDAPAPPSMPPMTSAVAAGHQMLLAAAFRVDWSSGAARLEPVAGPPPQSRRAPAEPPFAPIAYSEPSRSMDRWSLDAFAFYRQGSDAASISQARAPIYGASQVSANLQLRVAPSSRHDPRLYLRGYRALVKGGESEVAAGVSARPVGAVPVRLAAELRATDNVFGTEYRPAAFAVTEFAPLDLPFDLRAEGYGSAGYVGGRAATPFADGQAAITREVASVPGIGGEPVRLSIGGGAWGGAQRDAYRVDVGPTVRLDLSVGAVPARLSVDWREQVAGDAAPDSGVAATLSTRF